MDVLLINPKNKYRELHVFPLMPPLGLSSIGCVLEENGFSVKILDLEIETDNFDVATYISSISPKVVGISGTSYSRFESFRIARLAKEVSKDIITVYGGCHATFTTEDTLSHTLDIDYVVLREGEVTFLELVEFFIRGKGNRNNIKGISFRGGSNIIKTAPRERIVDLDRLSFSRHLLQMSRYDTRLRFLDVPSVSIITSRGCPYSCYFCSASAMFKNIYSMRSAKNVVDEIQYCIDTFKIKGVKFFDSTFTLKQEHVLSIIKELKKRNINIPWECEIRADTVERSLLAQMREAGCYYVNFGVESPSERVLQQIDKKNSIRQITNVLSWCYELGIKTKVFFSFGHLGESLHDSFQTISFIKKYLRYIDVLAISRTVKIYPGTALEKYARENNLLPENFSWSVSPKKDNGLLFVVNIPVLLQPGYGIDEFKKLYAKLRGVLLTTGFKRLMSSSIKDISWDMRRSAGPFLYLIKNIKLLFEIVLGKFNP